MSDYFLFQYRKQEQLIGKKMRFFITTCSTFCEVIYNKFFRPISYEFISENTTCLCFGSECMIKKPTLPEVVLYVIQGVLTFRLIILPPPPLPPGWSLRAPESVCQSTPEKCFSCESDFCLLFGDRPLMPCGTTGNHSLSGGWLYK